jgi:hypothetical protein
MFGLSGIKLWGALGALLALVGFVGWVVRLDQLRGKHLSDLTTLQGERDTFMGVLRTASDNPKLPWKFAGDQVQALAASRNGWKSTAVLQSSRIDALNQETMRLKALSEELRRKAEAAIAKRNNLAERLEQAALTPGDRTDCIRQLLDAEAALDLVWDQGL